MAGRSPDMLLIGWFQSRDPVRDDGDVCVWRTSVVDHFRAQKSVAPWFLAAVLILLVGSALLIRLDDGILYSPDSARYLLWANALAGGSGFADMSSPEPARYVVHAPLYPVLLAPVVLAAGLHVFAAKAWTLLFALLLAWSVFHWLSKEIHVWLALASMVFLSVHSLFLIYASQPLAEIPFTLALIVVIQRYSSIDRGSPTTRNFILLSLSLVACVFLREVGLVIVASILLLMAWKKEWKGIAIVGIVSLPLYAAWFIRNEIIIAGLEHPPLRNAELFLNHVFTPQSAPFLVELWERLVTNGSNYAGHLSTFLFAPQLGQSSYGLVSTQDPWIFIPMSVVPFLKPFFLLVPLVLSGAAIAYGWKKRSSVRVIVLILLFYSMPILLYPVYDIRFLFPAVVLILVLMAIGAHELLVRHTERMHAPRLRMLTAMLLMLFLFPNVFWSIAYLRGVPGHQGPGSGRLQDTQGAALLGDYYAKDFAGAGAWISDHARPGATIGCRAKELALWMKGRTVIDVGDFSPNSFERLIRDYDIPYLVTTKDQNGVRDYEIQIEYSSRYAFREVASFGVLAIIEIAPQNDEAPGFSSDDVSSEELVMFRDAMHQVQRGDPLAADSMLSDVEHRWGEGSGTLFHRAVAKALSGQLEGAHALFARVRAQHQAFDRAKLTWIHDDILDRYRRTVSDPDPVGRANKYNIMAINYWDLGYRAQTFRMLDSSLHAQPGFFPALVFGAIFSYADGRNAATLRYLRQAEAVDSVHVLVMGMKDVITLDGRLRGDMEDADRIGLLRDKASAFLRMDMGDDAIDVWLEVLRIDGSHRSTLSDLSRAYVSKRRFAPALRWMDRYIELYPEDAAFAKVRNELKERW